MYIKYIQKTGIPNPGTFLPPLRKCVFFCFPEYLYSASAGKARQYDVAFSVEVQSIVLSEHQSTMNPNMPVRDLLSIAREYEKVIPIRSRYKITLLKIPTPRFLVFYNGTRNQPLEQVLRLSDAFMETARKHQNDENQLKKAVRECIKNDILADYLSRKSREVINILMAEYDYETDIAVQKEKAAENFQLPIEEVCKKMELPYEEYLTLKNHKS